MLQLSLELPTGFIERWAEEPYTDLDFVLAHKVLADQKYAALYHHRAEGRIAVLDNSTHEFGKPLPIEDLASAAHAIKADYVIAPDIVNPRIDRMQWIQNLEWLSEHVERIKDVPTGAVLCGLDEYDRKTWIKAARGFEVKMLCFSFHIPERLTWFEEVKRGPLFHTFKRIHLLGMMSLGELRAWVEISEKHKDIQWSFDTAKPFKLGMRCQLLENCDMRSLRGGHMNSKKVLDLQTEDISDAQLEYIERNIVFLRKVCRGEA